MGAKRIVYIGFNQRNRLHFYDLIDDMKKTLRDNISKVKKKHEGKKRMEEVNNDYNMFLEHMLPPEQLKKTAFFKPDMTNSFKIMFKTFKENGVEIISTEKDSKLVDTGATYMSIDDVLKLDNVEQKISE